MAVGIATAEPVLAVVKVMVAGLTLVVLKYTVLPAVPAKLCVEYH